MAAGYDERWAAYTRRTTERTLDHLRPNAGERILDVGCGTGALLRAIAQREPKADVVGVDLSLPMLRAAGARLAGAALVGGEAGLLPLRSGTFDAVASSSSLHYWADPEGALGEIARVLRPGGRLVLTDWCDDFLACRLCDRWLRLTRSAHRRIYGAGECGAILANAGFEVASVQRYKISWLWGMMTLAGRKR